jgi:outer membrane protein assembly factor BamB
MWISPRAIIVLCAALALSACSSIWETDKEKQRKPAELPDLTNKIQIHTLWEKSIGEVTEDPGTNLRLAFSGTTLFSADADGVVIAHNGLTGREIWERETDLPLSAGPGVGDGLVVLGTRDGELLALNEKDGSERWRVRLTSEVLASPNADRGVVVAYTTDGRLHGLSGVDGRTIWVYDRPTPILTLHGSSSPVVDEGRVICGFANGKLAAINIITGEPLWEVSVSLPTGRSDLERIVDIDGDPVVKAGVVFAATYQGDVAAIAADSGGVFWRKQLSSYAGLDVNWRQVYVSDDEDRVWAIDPRSGSPVWKNNSLANRRITGPAVFGDYLLVGDLEGYVHWLSQEDGQVLARVEVGDEPITARPLVRGKVAFVLGRDGDLAALTLDPPPRK